jgi:hypothetical protein
MRDDELDDILNRAARRAPAPDPAVLNRISRALTSNLRPVRPLPPPPLLTAALYLIAATVALTGAAVLGPYGVQRMSPVEIAIIFPALAILIVAAAARYVAETIPGSPRRLAPAILPAATTALLLAIFALLFHDYHTTRFIPQGLTCLNAGLLHAIPASLAAWLLLRRGFAVNPRAAGLAIGTLAGLAGVAMLELHCANFEAPHLLVWHTAVVPLSAVAGALFIHQKT